MLQVGIVGAGNIATNRHVPAIRARDDVTLAGVFTPERDPGFPGDVRVVDTVEALCEAVDLVHVCSPPWVHVEQSRVALESGVHVLSEKPMATSVEDARELAAVAADSDAVYGLVHNFRFTTAMRRFRARLDGPITSAYAVQYAARDFNIDRHGAEWFERLQGGMFWDEGPHMVYLLQDLLGDLSVTDANASGGSVGPQSYRDLRATLSAGEARAGITMRHDQPITEWFLVASTPTETVAVDLFRGLVLSLPADSGLERLVRLPRLLGRGTYEFTRATLGYVRNRRRYPIPPAGFPALYDEFLAAARTGSDPPATANDGIATMAAMTEIADRAGL